MKKRRIVCLFVLGLHWFQGFYYHKCLALRLTLKGHKNVVLSWGTIPFSQKSGLGLFVMKFQKEDYYAAKDAAEDFIWLIGQKHLKRQIKSRSDFFGQLPSCSSLSWLQENENVVGLHSLLKHHSDFCSADKSLSITVRRALIGTCLKLILWNMSKSISRKHYCSLSTC